MLKAGRNSRRAVDDRVRSERPEPMCVAAMLPNGRGGLYRGRIIVAAGRIVGIEAIPAGHEDPNVDVDFTPHVALPGLIDLQLNGAFGHDITTDPATMWQIGEQLPAHGVTAFCPTVITSPPAQRHAAYRAVRSRPDGYLGAAILGLHIEGPVLSADNPGTHPKADLASGAAGLAAELLREADAVALVTIAPEVDDSLISIKQLAESGIAVSLGHTAATAAQAVSALDAGASAFTHLFNGMGPLHHREVGALGAGLLDSRAFVSLIADGRHLSAEAILTAWGLAGHERIMLVTDAMAGMGAPAGAYRIGSQRVECGETARNSEGNLAGSLAAMPEAARLMAETTGATWDEMASITSANQAKLLGDSDRGRLSPGSRADIAIVDSQLRPVATMIGGEIAYRWTESISVKTGIAGPRSARTRGPGAVVPGSIGVDIGGSAFRVGVFDGAGLRLVRRGATGRQRSAAEVIGEIRGTVHDLVLACAPDFDIRGIGVACAGIVDPDSGVVVEAVNLGWRDVALANQMGDPLGLPVAVDHDVYLAGKAEWDTGGGVGTGSMLYVSVGTGIASRMFTRSDSYRGRVHLAGELGFAPLGPGGTPLESVASGRAICDAYRRETGREATAAQIIASSRHDSVAARVWSNAADALAQGLAAAVCLHDPEIVVLGGGLTSAGYDLLDSLGPRITALLKPLRKPPAIVLAVHGDLSGLVGAALLGAGELTAPLGA